MSIDKNSIQILLQNRIISFFFCLWLSMHYKGGHRLKFFHYALFCSKKGVVWFRIDRLANWYTNDWYNFKASSKDEKKFLIERGYAPYKTNRYGLNKNNYNNYLSDFDLYNPKNYVSSRFAQLFEHKLNTYYLLSPFKNYMPRHYWYIDSKKVILPIDVQKRTAGTINDVMSLIEKTPIAAKACLGGHGRGFYKIVKSDNDYFINNERSERKDVEALICGLSDYILTDYLKPNQVLQHLCGEGSYSVIRTLSVFDKEDGPQITGAMIRLGCKKAGIVSDYDGTIYTGVELDSGKLFKPYIRETETWFSDCPNHPDTGIAIDEVEIICWDKIKETVKEITKYLPWAPYLVMDIIPTEDSFAILEINSHGEVQGIEGHYPFCLNKYNRKAFDI